MSADLLEATRDLPRIELPPGKVLIAESLSPEGLYFLESGAVDIFKGSSRIARENTPGAVFGEMSLLLESCATATVRAAEPCVFRAAWDGRAFLESHPAIALKLAHLLARRLEGVTRYVADLKVQFKESSTHFDMVESVVDTLIAKQPRHIERKNRGH